MCLIGVRYTQDFRVTLFRVTLIQAGVISQYIDDFLTLLMPADQVFSIWRCPEAG